MLHMHDFSLVFLKARIRSSPFYSPFCPSQKQSSIPVHQIPVSIQCVEITITLVTWSTSVAVMTKRICRNKQTKHKFYKYSSWLEPVTWKFMPQEEGFISLCPIAVMLLMKNCCSYYCHGFKKWSDQVRFERLLYGCSSQETLNFWRGRLAWSMQNRSLIW